MNKSFTLKKIISSDLFIIIVISLKCWGVPMTEFLPTLKKSVEEKCWWEKMVINAVGCLNVLNNWTKVIKHSRLTVGEKEMENFSLSSIFLHQKTHFYMMNNCYVKSGASDDHRERFLNCFSSRSHSKCSTCQLSLRTLWYITHFFLIVSILMWKLFFFAVLYAIFFI